MIFLQWQQLCVSAAIASKVLNEINAQPIDEPQRQVTRASGTLKVTRCNFTLKL